MQCRYVSGSIRVKSLCHFFFYLWCKILKYDLLNVIGQESRKKESDSLIKSFVLYWKILLISLFFSCRLKQSRATHGIVTLLWMTSGGKLENAVNFTYSWNINLSYFFLISKFLLLQPKLKLTYFFDGSFFIAHLKYYACIFAFLHVWKSYFTFEEITFTENMIKWVWAWTCEMLIIFAFGLSPHILSM